MVTQKSKSTSWSPLVAAARSLTTTTMVGRIFLCYAALVSEALRRARRIGCTRTIGMGPLRMSQKKQGCARSDGPAESASETTTTMALTTSFAPISARTCFTAIRETELSPMCPPGARLSSPVYLTWNPLSNAPQGEHFSDIASESGTSRDRSEAAIGLDRH